MVVVNLVSGLITLDFDGNGCTLFYRKHLSISGCINIIGAAGGLVGSIIDVSGSAHGDESFNIAHFLSNLRSVGVHVKFGRSVGIGHQVGETAGIFASYLSPLYGRVALQVFAYGAHTDVRIVLCVGQIDVAHIGSPLRSACHFRHSAVGSILQENLEVVDIGIIVIHQTSGGCCSINTPRSFHRQRSLGFFFHLDGNVLYFGRSLRVTIGEFELTHHHLIIGIAVLHTQTNLVDGRTRSEIGQVDLMLFPILTRSFTHRVFFPNVAVLEMHNQVEVRFFLSLFAALNGHVGFDGSG